MNSRRFHSITSSARASRVGGTSSPSALAVFRLITSSYLVGACTGEVAGLFPLEDAVDISRRAPVGLDDVGRVGNQAAGVDVGAFEENGR